MFQTTNQLVPPHQARCASDHFFLHAERREKYILLDSLFWTWMGKLLQNIFLVLAEHAKLVGGFNPS